MNDHKLSAEIRMKLEKESDRVLMKAIMARARALLLGRSQDRFITVEMSLLACHLNGTPLDFAKLLNFDDFNFTHDVVGIDRHMSRETGKLTNFFLPRCAAKS